jgi:hypothetical protein
MEHTHADNYQLETGRWNTGRNVLVFAALVSILACVAGYLTNEERFFRSYLVAFTFTSAIGLGAFFFVQVQYLTGSAWSVVLRRIMENIMVTLPWGVVLFIPVAFGLNYLYPWTNREFMLASEMLTAKMSYLDSNPFLIRTLAFFVVWSIWVFSIYHQSTKQDSTRSVQQMYVISRWSAPGLFLVVVVGSLAAFDWLMSLEPGWYSTIFGLYYLTDGGLAFMSLVTLICLGFRRSGVLANSINHEHYHDLGKWIFALTCFYTYIAVSQFLLIWYADLPEETVFYRHRAHGGWLAISLALPFLRFFIPFFTLIARPVKRKLKVVGVMAAYSLIMVYLDLYWVVMPNFYAEGPQIHWLDFATLGATVTVTGLVFWSRFKKHKLAPVGDLRFEQSLHFENA